MNRELAPAGLPGARTVPRTVQVCEQRWPGIVHCSLLIAQLIVHCSFCLTVQPRQVSDAE